MTGTDSVARLNAALADRYAIERELGQGGMATVYLAHDVRHDRKVALKVLRPELSAILGADRFLHEIKTTANLQHPHILGLFDSGEADGLVFYVMPYVEGESLRDRLNREKQLPVDDAVRIACEVADALQYAHTQGVVHRDIKPENILLHGGHATVADFGIALAASRSEGATRMTETGMSLGTPFYMSPEQAMGERDITPRADIYALACVLYEMLAGDPPFTGSTAQAVVARVLTEEPRSLVLQRKTVPPHVEAAVERALQKLPTDRFESAKTFADALANPSFADTRTGPPSAVLQAGARSVNRALIVLSAALAVTLGWQVTRPAGAPGPRAYDVALPDSAPINMRFRANFAVAPRGDFVIYVRGDHRELWYRSLLDATVRQIEATEGAGLPTISPEGKQVAFIRQGSAESTVEMMSMDGGTATVIAHSREPNSLEWLADGRILLTEGDGLRARSLDPGGGPSTDVRIRYCINPSPLPDRTTLLCGGGGDKLAGWSSLKDSASGGFFRTNGPDSSFAFGADFRVIDGRYLVWVSNGGDLLAATVDLAARRVGRSVRMVTGLGRGAYSGAGSYALSASGTLVYANGINEAVGHLVRADGRTLDTLPVGREAFLQFAVSPDGRRLAAVVEQFDGHELRLYDLRSGEHIVWIRRSVLRQPVWSATGDRLVTSTGDSVFAAPPDATSSPEFIFASDRYFEGFSWLPDGRLIGTAWNGHLVVAAHLDRRPPSFDTLATFAAMGRFSPDGRWLAYNAADFRALWIEPVPRTGQRYPAGTGYYPQWLSTSEFVTSTDEGHFEQIRVDASVQPPRITRRPWFDAPRFVGIAAGGFSLTPDGRVVYKEGAEIEPARYLRVVPNWVAQMERAVAEANR